MMKIEVWSDITCPFCYLGKHRLEEAIERFPHRDEVKIVWRSFELDPGAEIEPEGDIYEKLAARYGRSREWAIQANEELKQRAAEIGLEFHPDQVIPTNSFDAHRLIKLAAQYDLANQAQEKFFAAYFTEGRHIARHKTLKQIGTEIGLDSGEVDELLAGDAFTDEVRADEQEVESGIRGVPFFLFDRKYTISGAQPVDLFLQALRKCHEETYSRIAI